MTSYYTSDLCLIEQWTTDWHLRGKDVFFGVVRFHAIHHHWALAQILMPQCLTPKDHPSPISARGFGWCSRCRSWGVPSACGTRIMRFFTGAAVGW